MTTRASYHVETANDFLASAHTHLSQGDLKLASAKGWGAAVQMVRAVAEKHGWPHGTHGDLYSAIDQLVKETDDQNIGRLFRSASALHQNFYEGYMPEGTVASGIDDVEEITNLLAAVVD